MERRQSQAHSQNPVHNKTHPHSTQRKEMPILNDNSSQFSERNQLRCSYGNCLQFPATTTPYSEGRERTTAHGIGARPLRTGGKQQRGAAERGSAGTRRGSRCHVTHTARGSRRESPSWRFLPRADSEPATGPNSGTEHGSIPAQKPRRGRARGRRGGKGRAGKLQRLRTASQRRPALHQTADTGGPGAGRGQGKPGKGWRDGGMKGGRLLPPARSPNRPPHSFACRRAVT